MRIRNKTRYDGRTLKRIMLAVYKDMPKPLGQWPGLVVTISYVRQGGPTTMSGYAYYKGYEACIRLPKGKASVPHIGSIWLHELWHLYGRHHRDYARSERHYWQRPLTWLVEKNGLPEYLEEIPIKTAPKPTTDDRRVAKVAGLVKRRQAWQTKLKRATTALAKIEAALGRLAKLEVEGAAEALASKPPPKRRRRRRVKRARKGHSGEVLAS